jgi:Flp pilus assembly pilin Flp
MSIKTITSSLKRFFDRDEGAVTVDFVVLLSMITLFGIAVAITINTSTKGTADKVAGTMDGMSVWSY